MVRHASERGFTLIEMSIVVVIIGLLLSGSLLAVSPVIQGSKVSDTNARLDRLEQALTVYVIQNGCLPCPADRALASSSANAGWANNGTVYYGPTHTTNTRACSLTAVCGAFVGVLPWNALGIAESDITDAWGNRISYAVTAALTTTPSSSMVRTPPSTYPVGTQAIVNTSGTSQATNAAYVILSYGPDTTYGNAASTGVARGVAQYTFGATDASGRNNPANHVAATTAFAQGDFVGTASTAHFDDLVRWRTAPIIIQGCGTNACGNPS